MWLIFVLNHNLVWDIYYLYISILVVSEAYLWHYPACLSAVLGIQIQSICPEFRRSFVLKEWQRITDGWRQSEDKLILILCIVAKFIISSLHFLQSLGRDLLTDILRCSLSFYLQMLMWWAKNKQTTNSVSMTVFTIFTYAYIRNRWITCFIMCSSKIFFFHSVKNYVYIEVWMLPKIFQPTMQNYLKWLWEVFNPASQRLH